jgi:hypothetical protein
MPSATSRNGTGWGVPQNGAKRPRGENSSERIRRSWPQLTAFGAELGMEKEAWNVTMADDGFLNGCRYLPHDRDKKFTWGCDEISREVGVKAERLPPRGPNLNATCERWNRSVRVECFSKLILFMPGGGSARREGRLH